jgi:putative lipoic acid-binding regulatory protein
MSTDDSLLEFPCDFPLKVVGRAAPDFQSLVVGIVERHAGPVPDAHVRGRASRDVTFVALTCLIRATSKAQLDALYEELSGHERILMVL